MVSVYPDSPAFCRAIMDSMGEPTSRMAVTPLARYLFMSWSARSVARLRVSV